MGKGAGTLLPDFAGFMSIDDVIKPDDAGSPAERNKINNRYTNTLVSRLATETTPLVIIMQRLHPEDLCGFLMKGGSADRFVWLNIPGIIHDGSVTARTGSAEWYQAQIDEFDYTNVTPILYDLERKPEEFNSLGDASFWPIRKDIATLYGMKDKDPYTFYSQYMGMPRSKGKSALSNDLLRYYDTLDGFRFKYTFLTADTASTSKSYSDFSVMCYWGVTTQGELVLIDVHLGKWEVPELIIEVRNFWKKHNVFDYDNPTMCPRGLYMEDKSSGLFLNQQFLRDGTVTVKPVPRDGTPSNDKFGRFMNTVPYFAQGRVILPRDHEHIAHCRREILGMTNEGSDTGHDDFADNVSDACNVAFDLAQMSYEDWA